MFNLVLKEFLIQKKSILFSIGYCFFVILLFGRNKAFGQSVYIMATAAVSYLLLQGAAIADGKNNSDIVLNSLPVNRKSIVQAKYLSLAAYLALGLILPGLIGRILPMTINFPVRPVNSVGIAASVVSVGLMGSIYLPLIFKFGYNSTRYINIVLFMLTFFGPGIVVKRLLGQPSGIAGKIVGLFQNAPGWSVMLGILGITVILVAVSMVISLRIYNNKDLC